MLEMRTECERCGAPTPADGHGAVICSFECTFCVDCGIVLTAVCPNCGGGLLPRPVRARRAEDELS
jgi:hypothetical protein